MLYFRHPSSGQHDPTAWLPEHPDTPDRIRAIEALLAEADWAGAQLRSAPAASTIDLMQVHDPDLIARLSAVSDMGGGMIDEDTYMSRRSFDAALHAAGGASAMVRALLAGEDDVAFCGTRPPGHHAGVNQAMGFCLFNNVAVAAAVAIEEFGLRRVMILDWDVHHGNGTADIFAARDDVLYASIHEQRSFPGTGAASDSGFGRGYGYTLNLPVQAGSDGPLWLSMLEHIVIPVAVGFAPQLILISAGFDAHRADPVGSCRLEIDDFAQMAAHVCDLATQLSVPVGAVLEGGYHAPALAASVLATLHGLSGDIAPRSSAPDPYFTPRAASLVAQHWGL